MIDMLQESTLSRDELDAALRASRDSRAQPLPAVSKTVGSSGSGAAVAAAVGRGPYATEVEKMIEAEFKAMQAEQS